jgi:hypothetical protein
MVERIAKLEKVAHCARRVIDSFNEFFPDYPEAISEWMDHLDQALSVLDAPEWVLASKLGDNHPLTHWRCTGCGNVVGCYRKPDYLCETCQTVRKGVAT